MGDDARRAAFLDRDGVIVRAAVRDGKAYAVRALGDLELVPGAAEQVARLRKAGLEVVVVTNQPDVGRGDVAVDVLDAMHGRLRDELGVQEIEVCTCGEGCRRYKPEPGMLVDAADRLGIDLTRSFMIGDRWRDVDAGHAAGCTTVWLDLGYDEPLRGQPDHAVRSLEEAVTVVLSLV